MKYLIASDIHGSAYYADLIIEKFNKYNCDRLVLLGDILYHGPRNDLPKDYNPKHVASLLNSYKDKIIAVKGNCDADVDQMVLDFPIMASYAMLEFNGRLLYFTHGDVYNNDHLLPMSSKDILVHGHTHVVRCETHPTHTYINPGSISIPKEDWYHGYIILNDNVMSFIDEFDEVHNTYTI